MVLNMVLNRNIVLIGYVKQALAVLAVLVLFGSFESRVFAAESLPVIVAAEESMATRPSQLSIKGTGFGSNKPLVDLDGTSLLVLNYTQTTVVVQVPLSFDSSPGTYLLSLTNTSDIIQLTAYFVTATGAIGPAGPAGPKARKDPTEQLVLQAHRVCQDQPGSGPAGAGGPAGPTGPAGLTWRGIWDPGVTYNLNDVVTEGIANGGQSQREGDVSSYISLVAGNIGSRARSQPNSLAATGAGRLGWYARRARATRSARSAGTTRADRFHRRDWPAGSPRPSRHRWSRKFHLRKIRRRQRL